MGRVIERRFGVEVEKEHDYKTCSGTTCKIRGLTCTWGIVRQACEDGIYTVGN